MTMPRYFVYDKTDGTIVHVHETYDATAGLSVASSPEEVLEMVDETLPKENLEVLESEVDVRSVTGTIRVDPKTRTLATQPSDG
jgi:hypothetical protein